MRPHSLHSRFKRDLYEADVFALSALHGNSPHGAGIVASLINLITLYVVI